MAEIKIGPPPTPNRDKFPFVGTTEIQGIKINIENLAGSIREGKNANGKAWRTRMRYHYGEIPRGKGTDGDKLDVYVGPNPNAKMVYIVHQNHPADHPHKPGHYDEDKILIGFDSPEAAKRAYLKQYDRTDFFRSITTMTLDQFKKAIMQDKGEKIAAIVKAARFLSKSELRSYGEKRPKFDAAGRHKRVAKDQLKALEESSPSAFIRMKLREGGVKEAYDLGVELAIKEAAVTMLKQDSIAPIEPMKNIADTLSRDISRGALDKPVKLKNGAPAPAKSGTTPGATSGATDAANTTFYGK